MDRMEIEMIKEGNQRVKRFYLESPDDYRLVSLTEAGNTLKTKPGPNISERKS